MKHYVLGIDVGGRSMKFGLFTDEGQLISKSNIITRVEEDGKYIISDLIEHIEKIMEKYDLTSTNLVGIGVGIPGPILNKSTIKAAVNLGFKEPVNLKKEIEERFHIKTLVENDANVAALGELWQGAAKGNSNVVMVTLGTGVGGGIVIDGQIVSGTTGSGGEVGHIPVLETPLKRTCGCGGNRCLEQVASATGIEFLAQDYLFENDDESKLREIDNISAKDIFDSAKEGDEVANLIVDQYTSYLGRGLGIISAIVDPEMFVIGGGVSSAGSFLLERLQKSYKNYAFPVTSDCKFTIAELGNDAGIYGAAKLVLN